MFDFFDSNLIRGIVLILMILAFLGIWGWAWSRNRKEAFREASMLPLEDDDGQVPDSDGIEEKTKE
jgi:cytochrome c oxidase cbb3-type subunit 4